MSDQIERALEPLQDAAPSIYEVDHLVKRKGVLPLGSGKRKRPPRQKKPKKKKRTRVVVSRRVAQQRQTRRIEVEFLDAKAAFELASASDLSAAEDALESALHAR